VAKLIDSSLWIDFTRERSPPAIKQFVSTYIFAPDAALAEPVAFEVLRYATDQEAAGLEEQFQHVPLLRTPADLWSRAAELGQRCRKIGFAPGAMDLLISCVAIEHGAELITFDADFQQISRASSLRVKLLKRPAP
jgi:predicted nucleic acid-binding protein